MKKRNKIGIVTSKGGHLVEILQVTQAFNSCEIFFVTFKGEDVDYYLKNQKKYYAYYPESRNVINFFRNIFFALKVLNKEKPNFLISCGAGIAVPFFYIAKYIFGVKLIYIESFDFVAYPSLTGKLLYRIVDLFLVQHKIQLKWYPKAKYWGSLL